MDFLLKLINRYRGYCLYTYQVARKTHRSHPFIAGLSLVLLLLLFNQYVYAQNNQLRTMTILPFQDISIGSSNKELLQIKGEIIAGKKKYTSKAYIQFELSTIPEGSTVTSWTLRIYLNKAVDTSGEQLVKLYQLNELEIGSDLNRKSDSVINNMEALVAKGVNPSKPQSGIDFTYNIKSDNKKSLINRKNGLISFLLAAGSEDYYYYSSKVATAMGNHRLKPKLIINYRLPTRLNAFNWGQLKNDAQHTGQSPWYSNAYPTSLQFHKIITGDSSFYIDKMNPVIYKDFLIVPVQLTGITNTRATYFLRSYSIENPGKLISTSTPLNGLLKHQPVIDYKNRLYCITGNQGNNVQIFDLDNGLKTITSSFNVEDSSTNKITATPVIGSDGSIYLSTKKGLYAYTSDYDIKWKIDSNGHNHFGSVALSKDERKAYVVFGDAGQLITIDNTDGSIINKTKAFLTYDGTDEIEVPLPSVDTATGTVIVTDGFRKGQSFFVFDSLGKQLFSAYKADIFSEPVISNKSAYIIHNGSLERFDLTKGRVMNKSDLTSLNPSSSIVADIAGNIYILNTEENKHSIAVFDRDCKPVLSFNPQPLSDAANLLGNRLIFAPGGTLITGNNNFIIGMNPLTLSREYDNIALRGIISDHCIYRANKSVIVDAVTINNPNNVIIHSGGTISFKPGFQVSTGAQLSCKVGY
jgi:outer membrane protein assembly factor BamB